MPRLRTAHAPPLVIRAIAAVVRHERVSIGQAFGALRPRQAGQARRLHFAAGGIQLDDSIGVLGGHEQPPGRQADHVLGPVRQFDPFRFDRPAVPVDLDDPAALGLAKLVARDQRVAIVEPLNRRGTKIEPVLRPPDLVPSRVEFHDVSPLVTGHQPVPVRQPLAAVGV